MKTASKKHPSNSSEQKAAEIETLQALEKQFGVKLNARLQTNQRIDLDGFADGSLPVCVEVWAHQGPSKGAQPSKVMKDFCKLLLAEKLLGRPCCKVFAGDPQALAFLRNSWFGRFAKEFGIECIEISVSPKTRKRLQQAQKQQYR